MGLLVGCGPSAQWAEIPDEPYWPGAPSEYSIGILTGPAPFDVQDSIKRQADPVLRSADIKDLATAYVADPFLFPHNNRWYMFYELLQASPRRGRIAWAESDDGRNWSHRGLALVEPFHMSFPFIFEWEGDIYMLPESNEIGEVRLYKADHFPSEWSLASVLVTGIYVDSAILRHDGRWWLFSSSLDSRNLHLFYSDELLHGWTEHPQSPVVQNDIHRARPAGRVISYDDRLWRVGMDCWPRYGHATRLLEIMELTTSTYVQREAENSPVIAAGLFSWARLGMHHYDVWPYLDGKESWIMVVDGNTPAQPETPLEVQFADGSLLLGMTARPRYVSPGETLMLRLYWKNLPAMDERAHVFVHFMQAGELLFQGDHDLDERPEQYDLFLTVPPDAQPGDLAVYLGLHHPGRGRIAVRSPYPQGRRATKLPIDSTIATRDF